MVPTSKKGADLGFDRIAILLMVMMFQVHQVCGQVALNAEEEVACGDMSLQARAISSQVSSGRMLEYDGSWKCGYNASTPSAVFDCEVMCLCNATGGSNVEGQTTTGPLTVTTQSQATSVLGSVDTLIGDLTVYPAAGQTIVLTRLRRVTGTLSVTRGTMDAPELVVVGDMIVTGGAQGVNVPKFEGVCGGGLLMNAAGVRSLRLPSYRGGKLGRLAIAFAAGISNAVFELGQPPREVGGSAQYDGSEWGGLRLDVSNTFNAIWPQMRLSGVVGAASRRHRGPLRR